MPTLRIDASTISSGSFSDEILVWGFLVALAFAFVILRVLVHGYYVKDAPDTTIINVQQPNTTMHTSVEQTQASPYVSYITINIHPRHRAMSECTLSPPSSSYEVETKKEV